MDGITIDAKQKNQPPSSFFGRKNQVINGGRNFGHRVEMEDCQTQQKQKLPDSG
jgi:hypothetical protein